MRGSKFQNRFAVNIEYLADRPEFIPALAAWHRREWGHLRPEETVETRITKLQGWCGRNAVPTALVASQDDVLLGSALLVPHDMDSRPQWSPWLAGVVVAPEYRQRGIARMLTERAMAEARSLGFSTLYLYTFSTEEYYARLGWTVIDRTTYLSSPVTVMSIPLS